SDLHVVAGRPHTVPRSLVEAMSAGCAVAAIETEATREFVEDGRNGVVVADMDALYAESTRLLRGADARHPLGEMAGERVREQYARDVTLPGLVDLFDRLAMGRR